MAKRTNHICPPEAASLHDPATCPACERVANGEPALGPEASIELTEGEVDYLVGCCLEGDVLGPVLAEKLRGGRLFVVRPEAVVRNPGAT
jgi:hypothetical protein